MTDQPLTATSLRRCTGFVQFIANAPRVSKAFAILLFLVCCRRITLTHTRGKSLSAEIIRQARGVCPLHTHTSILSKFTVRVPYSRVRTSILDC